MVANDFVVAVLDASGDKRWVFVKHILHPKGNRGVIQPGAPSSGIVFGRRYRHDIFLLVLLHLDVLAAVLCKARYLGGGRRWQVKRVRCNQIEGNPLAHFPRAPRQRPISRRLRLGRFEGTECTCETDIVIFVLAGLLELASVTSGPFTPSFGKFCPALQKRRFFRASRRNQHAYVRA